MRILMAAGEVSGDRFAAGLARALKETHPDVRIAAIGSEALDAAGVDLRLDLSDTASIGLTEALPGLLHSLNFLRRAKKILKEESPDLFIPVDCQGINLKLIRKAKKLGIPVAYFIPPQNFFWGDGKTGRKMARLCDLIISIYKTGFDFYKSFGGNAVFAGHPLLDEVGGAVSLPVEAEGKRLVALVPGTRRQEIKRLLPVLQETARRLAARDPQLYFLIPAAGRRHRRILERALDGCGLPCGIVDGCAGAVLAKSSLYIGKTGTVSLEAALAGVPALLLYRISRISWLLLAHVAGLARKIRFVGLPNLLLGREVMPEFLQDRVRPDLLFREAEKLLYNIKKRSETEGVRREIVSLLGESGVYARAAAAVSAFMDERREG